MIDCYSRKILGYAIDTHYKTGLIMQAMEHALQYHDIPVNAIFHSDRGSNYMSREYSAYLHHHNIRQSAGAVGSCYDNSLAESFFSFVKRECCHRKKYRNHDEARSDIIQYIEHFYNSKRLHSHIGYLTPNEKYYQERKTTTTTAVA